MGDLFRTKAWDIVAYNFQADVWCPGCMREYAIEWVNSLIGSTSWNPEGMDVEDVIKKWADEIGLDYGDESSYDSGDFPKVVFYYMVEDTEHCGQCHSEI